MVSIEYLEARKKSLLDLDFDRLVIFHLHRLFGLNFLDWFTLRVHFLLFRLGRAQVVARLGRVGLKRRTQTACLLLHHVQLLHKGDAREAREN